MGGGWRILRCKLAHKTAAPKSLLVSKMSSSWPSTVTIHLCRWNSGTKSDLFVKEQDWKGYYTCIHHTRNPYLTSQTHVNVLLQLGGGTCYGSRQRLYVEKHELLKKKKKPQKSPNGFYPGHHPYQKPSPCLKKGRKEGSKQFSDKQDRRYVFACPRSL